MTLRMRVEDAAIAALGDLLAPGLGGGPDGYLSSVQPYAGEFANPDPDDFELKQLLEGGTPCIGVSTDDGNYQDVRLRRLAADIELTIELLIVSGNLRGPEERQRGDGVSRDPGIYQILEDVRDRLFLDDLGVDGAGHCTPVRETAVIRTQAVTVWHAVYAITGDVKARRPDRNDEDITSIRTRVNRADDDRANPVVIADRSFT